MLTWAGGRVGASGFRRVNRLIAGVSLGAPGRNGTWQGFRGELYRLLLIGVSALALLGLSTGFAAAQTWTGATSSDWTVGSNWSTGVVPGVGTVVIGTSSPNPTVLGVGGPIAGTTGQLTVGTANLTIQNGSTLTSSSIAANRFQIGVNSGNTGIVNVTGAGSEWTALGAPTRRRNGRQWHAQHSRRREGYRHVGRCCRLL